MTNHVYSQINTFLGSLSPSLRDLNIAMVRVFEEVDFTKLNEEELKDFQKVLESLLGKIRMADNFELVKFFESAAETNFEWLMRAFEFLWSRKSNMYILILILIRIDDSELKSESEIDDFLYMLVTRFRSIDPYFLETLFLIDLLRTKDNEKDTSIFFASGILLDSVDEDMRNLIRNLPQAIRNNSFLSKIDRYKAIHSLLKKLVNTTYSIGYISHPGIKNLFILGKNKRIMKELLQIFIDYAIDCTEKDPSILNYFLGVFLSYDLSIVENINRIQSIKDYSEDISENGKYTTILADLKSIKSNFDFLKDIIFKSSQGHMLLMQIYSRLQDGMEPRSLSDKYSKYSRIFEKHINSTIFSFDWLFHFLENSSPDLRMELSTSKGSVINLLIHGSIKTVTLNNLLGIIDLLTKHIKNDYVRDRRIEELRTSFIYLLLQYLNTSWKGGVNIDFKELYLIINEFGVRNILKQMNETIENSKNTFENISHLLDEIDKPEIETALEKLELDIKLNIKKEEKRKYVAEHGHIDMHGTDVIEDIQDSRATILYKLDQQINYNREGLLKDWSGIVEMILAEAEREA